MASSTDRHPSPPVALAQDEPSTQDAAAAQSIELLDGLPSVRAWIAAIAIVILQICALVWGLTVLP
ncbi:MAG: hypothetical protein EXR77_15890 [Myxococcales bacterium]|nr:hypothetical protein [Myxococcales bacterium]